MSVAITGAGIAASSLLGGATIRQVQTATQTSNFTVSVYSWTDFLSVTINLFSSSSYVLVCGVIMGGAPDHGGARVTRNGTQVPYAGNIGRGSSLKTIIPSTYTASFGNNAILGGGFMFIDQPGQTNNTYKIQVACGPSNSPATFNVGYNTSGSSAYFDAVNYIQVIELA